MLHKVLNGFSQTGGMFTPGVVMLFGAFLTAFAVAVAARGPVIAIFVRRGLLERTEKTPIEDERVLAAAAGKKNIPTMGGVIIGIGVAVGAFVWGDAASMDLWLCVGCFFLMGAVGMVDDYMKIRGPNRRDRGLKVRHKLVLQGAVGAGLGLIYRSFLREGLFDSSWPLPGHSVLLSSPVLWVTCSALAVALLSNSVNVADGMDGLAGGLSVAALAPLAILAALSNSPGVAMFCALLCGATLGFLWHNIHPARVFMGDTGSMAIGGSFGLAALLSGYELLLPVLAFVFLVEFFSSVIQVLVFKATGRRLFAIAPVHHIFQQKKWPEMQTVGRFWIAGLICSLAALSLAAVLAANQGI